MILIKISIVLLVIIYILLLIKFFNSKTLFNLTLNAVCIVITMITIAILASCFTEPRAIDVYRNKTTLEITYKDNLPIDSIVVFK